MVGSIRLTAEKKNPITEKKLSDSIVIVVPKFMKEAEIAREKELASLKIIPK